MPAYYFTAPGRNKSCLLDGIERARQSTGPVLICKGTTDVWRAGKDAVAFFVVLSLTTPPPADPLARVPPAEAERGRKTAVASSLRLGEGLVDSQPLWFLIIEKG